MKKPTLYIFSGLPASGKSTIAQELAKHTHATFIRIDTLEQGLRDLCNYNQLEGEGYRLSYRVVADNLKLGNDVIADSCNPWELTRREWNEVATSVGANFVNIEVLCSDPKEHKHRVENRQVGIATLKLPTWEEVLNRDYQQWSMPRIVLDTAGKDLKLSLKELLLALPLNLSPSLLAGTTILSE
ncbi:MAG: ATP-binding protein [Bdellovibrio sp.]|nr:ATP-binding protein [Bdellovibrio sp.]